MYVTNRHYFGRLLEASTFTTNRLHNDMYQMMDNHVVSTGHEFVLSYEMKCL